MLGRFTGRQTPQVCRDSWALNDMGDMKHTVYQSFYASFIPSNPNTPLLLAVSSPPLTPPAGPSSTAGSRQSMPSRASQILNSSPSSFPILSLNLVILRSELCHELTTSPKTLQ